MSKLSREVLLERTTDVEVFQDMDNFELLNDYSKFALSIRLQFPKFSKGFSPSDFELFVKEIVGDENIVSIGRLSFPNEWQIQVNSKNVRENLIRMGRTKINTRTCWISPLCQLEVRGYIHWIPSAIPNTKLEEILRAYGKILLMENQKQTKWKTKVDCDSRYFGLFLTPGKTMDDVPHFIYIDEYYGLITIRGRSPSCFHCKEIGHRKSECKQYREKISGYCLRPAGEGAPRLKPRGKRFRKHWQAKHVNQEVQTETSCSECIKEQLAAEAAKAEANATLASNAEETEQSSGTDSGAVFSVAEASEDGVEDDSVGQPNTMLTLSVEDRVKPGFWRKVKEERKRLKLAKDEASLAEFKAKVKAICEGPVEEFAYLSETLSVAGDDKRKLQERVSGEKSSSMSQDPLKLTQELKTVVEKASETEVKENADQGPLSQMEQLQKTIEEVLATTRESLVHEFDIAKQILLQHSAEKSSSSKKKRKKRKKKKAVVEAPQVTN